MGRLTPHRNPRTTAGNNPTASISVPGCKGNEPFGFLHGNALSLTAVLLFAGLLLASGCSPGSLRIDLWILDAMRVAPGDPIGEHRKGRPGAGPQRLQAAGAINETLSFRFAVRPQGLIPSDVQIQVSPFTSPEARIDPSVVQIYRMEQVAIDRFPGWHVRSIPADQRVAHPLDVLVPLGTGGGGLYRTLLSNETRVFWVDITIPKGTVAGTYSGQIELTSNDTPIAELPMELTVWPFVLPDVGDVAAIAEIDPRTLLRHRATGRAGGASAGSDHDRNALEPDEPGELLRSTLRLLQAHRLTPVLPGLKPMVKVDAHGDVAIDWAYYDSIVGPCLDGRGFSNRVPLAHWPVPLGEIFPSPRSNGLISPSGYSAIQRRYLTLCAQHFEERGWLAHCYAIAPTTIPLTPQSARWISEFASAVHVADAHLDTASRLWPQDMGPYGWVDYPYAAFGDAVDIWMPPAQFYDVQAMAAQRAAGRRTWLALDRPPYSGTTAVQARSVDVRVLSWQAAQLGCEAYHVGCVNQWPNSMEDPTPDRCIISDPNTLLYPGTPFGVGGPVPSVRLKYLRQSQQDAAYRTLLLEHGLGHISDTLGKSLVGYAGSDAYRTHFADGRRPGWANDPSMYDLGREIMAGELMRTLRSRDSRHSTTFARTAEWRQFMLGTRRLRLDVDGIRFRVTADRRRGVGWEGHVDCTLTIANRRRIPVGGIMRFSDLAADWAAVIEEREVPAVPPDTSRRLTVTARATSMPSSRTGHVPLSVEFTSDDGNVYNRTAQLACIAARPFEGSITIDGDLSDWPPGSGNVAAGFLPIARDVDGSSSDKGTDAERHTMAFVMRDGYNLYVAINCACEGELGAAEARRNIVEYDDMIPVGDELVEILVDPLNSGTRSPTDLYHIVVKPSGTYLTEKGIGFDPPCGRREPWSAEIEIAAGTHVGRWIVEMRIPLGTFRDAPTTHTVWGFNVTRFEAAHQVFTTWSGASGNAYDPLSLGNLYLP